MPKGWTLRTRTHEGTRGRERVTGEAYIGSRCVGTAFGPTRAACEQALRVSMRRRVLQNRFMWKGHICYQVTHYEEPGTKVFSLCGREHAVPEDAVVYYKHTQVPTCKTCRRVKEAMN